MKSLSDIASLSPDKVKDILNLAADMKANPQQYATACKGKQLVLVFEKPSLRTRVSFEVGMQSMGGNSLFLQGSEVGLGTREPVKDVARTLSRYADIVALRVFDQAHIDEFIEVSDIPVINALSDRHHPCQAFADLMTIRENHHGATVVLYIGDGNNVARSLMEICQKDSQIECRICTPKEHELSIPKDYQRISVFNDPVIAAKGADVIYTDVWTSMGQEAELKKRLQDFQGFTLDEALIQMANPGVKVLHCLPAHRGEEISETVFESQFQNIFDQTENRMHVQKALMYRLLGN